MSFGYELPLRNFYKENFISYSLLTVVVVKTSCNILQDQLHHFVLFFYSIFHIPKYYLLFLTVISIFIYRLIGFIICLFNNLNQCSKLFQRPMFLVIIKVYRRYLFFKLKISKHRYFPFEGKTGTSEVTFQFSIFPSFYSLFRILNNEDTCAPFSLTNRL